MYFKYFCSVIASAILLASCSKEKKQFTRLETEETGITFSNRIAENDTMNILAFEYVYNGGGVAMGDFNNDSLQDVYFTGNSVANKLYLNKGDFKFEDVTKKAGVGAENKWSTGVSVVDINNDGLLDIYVCASVRKEAKERENMLFVNQGIDKDKVPVFKEMAKEYGVSDTTHSTNSAFFDYDNDGDLDLFVLVNEMDDHNFPNKFHKKIVDGSSKRTDRLFRNDWSDALNHPVFTNVSSEAGILIEGYGLGVNVTDINQDGWKDIYITNDYLTNDLMYVNQGIKDGKHAGFVNMADSYFKHTSHSAMGNDVADINNDGLPDIVAVDMMPEMNYRKKMMTPANSYINYQNNDLFGYQYQVARNTLQLNQGDKKNMIFSEIGLLSGIAETDWSWTPMLTDFDNDGLRDLIITNGFPRDISDLDFVAYRNEVYGLVTKMDMRDSIPSVKIKNYAFKNRGDLTFDNVTDDWGIDMPSFSNGAAYADLDNDGDLDYVVNNINDSAFVFRNNARGLYPDISNSLRIRFEGERYNRNGLGAIVKITFNQKEIQIAENSPYRGYLSSVEAMVHFGLGKIKKIDKLEVTWPGGKRQVLTNIPSGLLTLSEKNATVGDNSQPSAPPTLLQNISQIIPFKHQETDFIDFNIQKLLPHKLSQYGPALAVADIDGDGLEDVFVGGSVHQKGTFLIQKKDGKFEISDRIRVEDNASKVAEDMGALLFDADGDGDNDLYLVSGSYEMQGPKEDLQDWLYINDGKGNFTADRSALPGIFSSGSCVKATDFDRDGDLDLFIGGRVEPAGYPKPVSSFILRNDSDKGGVRFTDITSKIAPELNQIGLICDALWSDFDDDGWMDLILAGEWMPITFMKNTNGKFSKIKTAGDNKTGWWMSLTAGDFDNDGDTDYIAGNMGTNTLFRVRPNKPVTLYAKDFNKDGYFDAIPMVYYKAEDQTYQEFPYNTRDEMGKQVIQVRQRFQEYERYAKSGINDIFKPEELEDAIKLSANWMKSSYIENKGKAGFVIGELPMEAQFGPIFGMVVDDFDNDGNPDVLICGNDFGSDVAGGRNDAQNGLFLKGNGAGGFQAKPLWQSGFRVSGNAKAMVEITTANGNTLAITSQNRDSLIVHRVNRHSTFSTVMGTDTKALLKLANGKTRKQEVYLGSSFLSQTTSRLIIPSTVKEVEMVSSKGVSRKLTVK